MNMHVVLEMTLVAIIVFLLISRPQEEAMNGLPEEAKYKPDFNYFMEYYPSAKVQGYFVSKAAVERDIEEIREECGPAFEEKGYWKFDYSEIKQNNTMTIWVDKDNGEIVCMIEDLLNRDMKVPFGIKQIRKEIKVRDGSEIDESILFYNINGNDTCYIKVSFIEKPDWEIRLDPPLQLYRPAEKDPVEMNIKMEPSGLLIFKPERFPPNENYVEIEGIDGIVRIKPVAMKIYTPTLPKNVTEPQKYSLVLNVTASYHRGMRLYEYGSEILNYTIILE